MMILWKRRGCFTETVYHIWWRRFERMFVHSLV